MLSGALPGMNVAKGWPQDGLEPLDECPVCGAAERELVHGQLEDKVFRCAGGQWDLHRCTRCGSGYLDPRPTTQTIGLAYQKYWTHNSAEGVETPPRSWWRQRRNAQRNGWLNQELGYDLSPASRAPVWLSSRRLQRFCDRVAYLSYPGRGARVLDVGCGNGAFLLQMRAAGWDVAGVETDPKSAAQARALGLNVEAGPLTPDSFEDGSFDAITLKHVIEHLHDPVSILQACHKFLKPAGHISISTPNFASAGHGKYGRNYFPLQPPSHLVLFTPESLRLALQKAGFEPEAAPRARLVPREWFEASIRIRKGADVMSGRPRLSLFEKLEAAWLARLCTRRTRTQPELTEELVLLARKVA